MELIVKGMTCGHCEAAVIGAVKRVAPRAEVSVERARDRVVIAGEAEVAGVSAAIRAEGYEVEARP